MGDISQPMRGTAVVLCTSVTKLVTRKYGNLWELSVGAWALLANQEKTVPLCIRGSNPSCHGSNASSGKSKKENPTSTSNRGAPSSTSLSRKYPYRVKIGTLKN